MPECLHDEKKKHLAQRAGDETVGKSLVPMLLHHVHLRPSCSALLLTICLAPAAAAAATSAAVGGGRAPAAAAAAATSPPSQARGRLCSRTASTAIGGGCPAEPWPAPHTTHAHTTIHTIRFTATGGGSSSSTNASSRAHLRKHIIMVAADARMKRSAAQQMASTAPLPGRRRSFGMSPAARPSCSTYQAATA